MAEKYFGQIPPIVLPERKPQQEPKQNGTRTSILKAPSKLSYVQMGYRAPTLDKNSQETSKDQFALEVLVGILSQSSSARLTQNLVRDSRIALNVGAGYSMVNRGNESSFELYATPSQTTSTSELIAALKEELNKIKRDGVTEEELKRVKTIVIADDVYQKDSVFNAAMQIGQLETQGYSYEILDDYIKNIKKVTSSDIQNAAIKYFTDDTLTVVTIDPQPLDTSKPKKGKPHVH
jgi:zinc protease